MKKNELSNTQDGRLTALFDKVSAIIEQSRNLVYATANFAEVKARYEVGRYIFEDEQQGERAAYGKDLLRQLSKKLMEKLFGTSTQVVVIVPGNTCGSITVTEFEEGGQNNAKIEKR